MLQKGSYMGMVVTYRIHIGENKTKDIIPTRATQDTTNRDRDRDRNRKKKISKHSIRASEHLISAGLIQKVDD